MSTQESQNLKDLIRTAGQALLEQSSTGAAFLPLDEKNYVAVGTLAGIVSVAGKDFPAESRTAGAAKGGITSLEGLTRYDLCRSGDGGAFMEDWPAGDYVRFDDVERLLASTAGEQAEPADVIAAAELYTCVGKGGEYELLGVALGAGPCKGSRMTVYRDARDGALYFRTEADFERRMQPATGKLRAALAEGAAPTAAQAAGRSDEAPDDMCPNCVTPWKCNGPHIPSGDGAVFAAPTAAWLIEWKTASGGERRMVSLHNFAADIRSEHGNATVVELIAREAAPAPAEAKSATSGASVAAPASPEQVQAEPTAWITFESLDGKQKLEMGTVASNIEYTKVHKSWKWLPLYLAAPSTAAPAAEEVRNQALEEAARCVEDYQADKGIVSFNDIAHDIRAMKRAASTEGETR